jgi:hypothetical protein
MRKTARPAAVAAQAVFALKATPVLGVSRRRVSESRHAHAREFPVLGGGVGDRSIVVRQGAGYARERGQGRGGSRAGAKVSINGTPATYVNGVSIGGAQPGCEVQGRDRRGAEEAEARAAVRSDGVYVALATVNSGRPSRKKKRTRPRCGRFRSEPAHRVGRRRRSSRSSSSPISNARIASEPSARRRSSVRSTQGRSDSVEGRAVAVSSARCTGPRSLRARRAPRRAT